MIKEHAATLAMTGHSWKKRMVNTLKGINDPMAPAHGKDCHGLIAKYLTKYADGTETIHLLGSKEKNSVFVTHAIVVDSNDEIRADFFWNKHGKFIPDDDGKHSYQYRERNGVPIWMKPVESLNVKDFLSENDLEELVEREDNENDT
ncbi:hypothetical protein GR7B_00093 [Vibrio phage vB_VcorM_GR7B]|nr:hypothetical protein GR7B_00093 [Vibrio phage vB_VcorM_GR7B]